MMEWQPTRQGTLINWRQYSLVPRRGLRGLAVDAAWGLSGGLLDRRNYSSGVPVMHNHFNKLGEILPSEHPSGIRVRDSFPRRRTCLSSYWLWERHAGVLLIGTHRSKGWAVIKSLWPYSGSWLMVLSLVCCGLAHNCMLHPHHFVTVNQQGFHMPIWGGRKCVYKYNHLCASFDYRDHMVLMFLLLLLLSLLMWISFVSLQWPTISVNDKHSECSTMLFHLYITAGAVNKGNSNKPNLLLSAVLPVTFQFCLLFHFLFIIYFASLCRSRSLSSSLCM